MDQPTPRFQQEEDLHKELLSKSIELLLLENDSLNALKIKQFLAKNAPRIRQHRLRNGHEAMDFLKQKGEHSNALIPDIIILDVNLPQIDGYQILDYLKSMPNLSAIPIVAILSDGNRDDSMKLTRFTANTENVSENIRPELEAAILAVDALIKNS